jgi:phenylalanyl-tRNA synthetase alpha chain
LQAELARLREAAEAEIAAAESTEGLEAIRVRYLGRKGSLNAILRGLGQLPAEERPAMGALANTVRDAVAAAVDAKGDALAHAGLERAIAEERLDVTLPGRRRPRGHLHPLRQTEDDLIDIFVSMGFSVAEGPEVEDDFHNFGGLNFPPDHPARDAQDTFFLADSGGLLLRTHTSPVQLHVMRSTPPPIRVVMPGTCYRRDDPDPTHSPMFQQIEGLLVDERVSFADLKGVLTTFLRRLFGPDTGVRFRASFFPFTEPSAEVDIACIKCPPGASRADCRICKGSGWLEILGSGMVHPNVLRAGGYDPERVRGFAFGMGIDRLTLLRHELDDLRLLYDDDLRFLAQF